MIVDTPHAEVVRPSLLRIFALETRFELSKALRMPAYSLPTIAFPVVFYLLFGLGMRTPGSDGVQVATYLLASYGAFGVIGAALFGFGVGVATERGQGWLLLKRATPMPPLAYFTAKLLTAAVFAAAIVLSLSALGAFFGGVDLALRSWSRLFAVLVGGTLPFAAVGLALGFLCGPNSAPAIVNLLYLPSAFASGLWLPLKMLPGFFQRIAPLLAPYHLGQLALKVVGMDEGRPVVQHLFALFVYAAAGLAAATLLYRRGSNKTYG